MKKFLFFFTIISFFILISCAESPGGGDGGSDTDPSKPEIEILENENPIINGLENYSIGSQLVGTSKDVVFTLKNTGTADLVFTNNPVITVTGNCFSLKTDAASQTVKAGESEDFCLCFNPLDSISYTAAIVIENNDSDENNFNFTVVGTGDALPAPEIIVKIGSDEYISGSDYTFSNVIADGNNGLTGDEITFTIDNTGTADLSISDISITGDDKDDFDLSADFSNPVAASANMNISLKFDPLTTGTKNAVLNISSNDGDEALYTINLTGEAVAVPAPEINVKQGSVSLESGTGSYHFGTVTADGSEGTVGSQITFTIENTGNKELDISNIEITGTNADNFDLSANVSSPIDGSDSADISIIFDPLSVDFKSAVLNIESTDDDEATYTIELTGYGKSATEKNVHLSGYRELSSEPLAVYWKNRVDQNTFGSITNPSNAYSIFVSGSDVYISGEIENASGKSVATWWINGIKQSDLSDGTTNAEARDIFVSGSDVYIAGYAEDASGDSSAKLWKNGVDQNIVVAGYSSAKSVFVDGSDVYVAGSDEGYGILWKNGTKEYTLTSGTSWSDANSVFADSGDVYICGNISDSSGNTAASWWKNGVKQSAIATGVEWSTANSIYVSDNDVYIAGCEDINSGNGTVLKWWKNGIIQPNLTDGSHNSEANSILVVGNEIFIAGYEENASEVGIAKLWINGIDQNISVDYSDSQVYDIFITD